MIWKSKIITAYPGMFPGVLNQSIIGKALKEKKWSLEIIDLHEFGYDDGWQGHFIPSTLTEIIVSLIMAGREEEAKKFLDDMWPDNLTDKELFWSLLKEQVDQSKYWDY